MANPKKTTPPRKTSPTKKAASSKLAAIMTEDGCTAAGGVWLGGQCVFEATLSLRVFKGNPCQNDTITRIVRASDPAFRTLANVGLANK